MDKTIIESFKYCPYCCSSSLEINGKYLFCVECNFTFYINVACASVAIIKINNEYLFTIRKNEPFKEMLHLPGGFIDKGESAEFALIRELKEELGLNIERTQIKYYKSLPNLFVFENIQYNIVDLYFEVTLKTKPNIIIGSDAADYKWITLDNLKIEKIGFDSIKKLFKELLMVTSYDQGMPPSSALPI